MTSKPGIAPAHLRRYVIRPVLEPLDLWSPQAEDLLVLTAAHESRGGRYLAQVGGPALGLYQMEPDTHLDLWESYLEFRGGTSRGLERLGWGRSPPERLAWDLGYATVCARFQYLRVSQPIPSVVGGAALVGGDQSGLVELAEYWHRHWCRGCKGTVQEAVRDYLEYHGSGFSGPPGAPL